MLKNVGSNWLLTLTQIGVAFVLMPFTIRMLGNDQYGTWVLITAITSYLSMLALGVPMATVRFVSRYAATGDQEGLDRTIGSCVGLYGLIGAASLVVGAILFVVFHLTYDVPAAFSTRVDAAFALTVLFVSMSFLGQLPYGIMNGHQEFVLRNRIETLGLLVRMGLTFLLLTLQASLVWLAVAQLLAFACEFTVALIMVRRRYPRVHIRLGNFEWTMVRKIFSFSAFVLLLQLGAQLAFRTDSIVIGAFLPLSAIPHFSVSSSLATYTIQFVLAIGAVVMPAASDLEARGLTGELRDLLLKWSKLALSFSIIASLSLVVLGPRFIAWWISPDFERPAGDVLRLLMIANLVYLPARGVALPVLMGMGRPALATWGFLGAAVVNLALSIILVRPFGLNGVALGTALPNVAFSVYVVLLACRAVELRATEYVRYVVPRALLGGVPVLVFLLWLRLGAGVHGFAQLFVSGTATLVVFGLTWIFFVYRGDRYVDVGRWIRQAAVAGRA